MKENDTLKQEGYNLFSKLVSYMPMIFYILDKDWNFLLSDGQALQKLGLHPGEVVGRNAKDMYKDHPDILDVIENAFKGRTIKYDQKLGALFLEDYISPFYNKNGEIEGIIGATIDVTERKLNEIELSKTRALYEALIESVPGILYLYNDSGELIFWNKFHETMTGYSREELDHFPLMNWYKDDPVSQEAVSKGLENTLKYGFGQTEANLQCKDGSIIPMYMTACPLKMDDKDFFVGVGLDITSRVEAEKKLQELNRTLEEKVEKRTHELNNANETLTAMNEELAVMNDDLTAMNEEMRAINEELSELNEKLVQMQKFLVESEKMAALGGLVAGVAHEVNTPIGIGLTAASHLSDIANELLSLRKERPLRDEDLVPYLEDIDKASQIIFKNLTRSAHLIRSFKQLSVDQTLEPKREFELGEYIEEILLSLSPSLKKTQINITVSCPDPIKLNGYPGLIAQIITNLVMNALKHAYHLGDVGNINICVTRKSPMIELIFSDDGAGMDSLTLSRIYEPFFTTNRSTGGTGLGLSIVYSIVTLQYEGFIKCTSALGKGTTFIIDLKEDIQ